MQTVKKQDKWLQLYTKHCNEHLKHKPAILNHNMNSNSIMPFLVQNKIKYNKGLTTQV